MGYRRTALPADVPIPSDTKGRTEGYIDDATNAVLDSPENSKIVARARLCILMAPPPPQLPTR
eukprot:scaffold2523_cov193-Skeletonema_menzelii.AAC.5